jgi:hypothetical protein
MSIADTYVSGLGEVEDLGDGCFRFTFFAKHHVNDREERVVVVKLICPMSAVPPAIVMAAKAVGYSVAAGAYFPRQSLH